MRTRLIILLMFFISKTSRTTDAILFREIQSKEIEILMY